MANTFNDFFSNIVKNLKIPEYQCENDLCSILPSHHALQAIMKYRNHPSINIIRHFSQRYSSFYFSQVEKNTVLKEIRRLSSKKAVQETDIPVKIWKENADFFCWTSLSSIQWSHMFIKISCNFQICKCNTCFQKKQLKSKR